MTTRKAILFEGVEAFCDFIRTHGGSARSQSGYMMYQVKAPKDDKENAFSRATWLVLFGFHPRRKLFGQQKFKRVDVVERKDSLHYKQKGQGEVSMPIVSRAQGSTLTEFITLAPWQVSRNDARQIVMFWLRDPDLLTRLVGDSMALSNDRIRYAPIKSESSPEGILVRIELPSVYLLQLCKESFAKDIDLYYPAGEKLFLSWGYDYPLLDLWERNQHINPDSGGGKWRFFSPDGNVRYLEPVRWEDIYDAVDFEFEAPNASQWLADDQTQYRIRLQLSSENRNRAQEPEMWMISESERTQLESLLVAIDEADLDSLFLSVQQDDQGRRLFFIREKHTASKKKFFDFTGLRLATYKGYPNLFLPVDCELQPQLRRDHYPRLFELSSGELTVMVPADGEAENGKLLRLNERSFKPLKHYVDYLIEAERELLQDVVTNSVLDFAHYARAPKRTDLVQSKTERKPAATEQDESAKLAMDSEESTHKALSTKRRERTRPDDEPWETVPRSDLEKEEQELELQLAAESPTVELWSELLQIKATLDKPSGAVTCAVEAIWLSEPGPAADQLHSQLCRMLQRSVNTLGSEHQPLQIASEIHAQANEYSGDTVQLNAWLQQAITKLREAETEFRVKELWLLWGQLLKYNRDHVEQARVREQVLQQLGVGLSHEEIPDFIRAALMRSTQIDEDSGDDLAFAVANLREIEQRIKEIESQDLRAPALAMTARANARIGLFDRARSLCSEATPTNELNPLASCLVHLFAREALTSSDESESRRNGELYQKQYAELSLSDAQTLEEIEQSLGARREVENVAELLSAENYRLFFPVGKNDADPELTSLLELYVAGETIDIDAVLSIISNWQQDTTLDEQQMAARTRQLVQGLLTRMQWGSDGPRLMAAFDNLISVTSKRFTAKSQDFYSHLLEVSFAQGLLQLGQETRAAGFMENPIEAQRMNLLDLIDVCSARLTVIESLQLSERDALLGTLVEHLSHGVSGVYVIHALRVLDQTIEAAVSKDKFAVQKIRQYIDHEEFMIRQRVLSEDFCKTGEPTS